MFKKRYNINNKQCASHLSMVKGDSNVDKLKAKRPIHGDP